MTDEELKFNILSNFDFAFKIDWTDIHHRKIHTYLTSLTMYFGVKFNGHIASAGNFLAYRFNEQADKDSKIEMYRTLFKNESLTFSEEVCGGCHIFTF